MKTNIIYNKSCLNMEEVEDNSIDLIATDPPYGIKFMSKQWDRAIPSLAIWRESLRVLKPGAFAFVMCIPRQDCLARMIVSLEDAGFNVNFSSIYWAYASGFPKAQNIGKAVDKRWKKRTEYNELADYLKSTRKEASLSQKDIAKHFPSITGGLTGCVWNWENGKNVPTQEQWIILKKILSLDRQFDWLIEQETKRWEEAEREIIGKDKHWGQAGSSIGIGGQEWDITKPSSPAAKALDGSYGGFQPKPAVEVVIVAMKPLSEKTYVDQALANRHGISWLDDCRVPFHNKQDADIAHNNALGPVERYKTKKRIYEGGKDSAGFQDTFRPQGRFPSHLLVSDDCLNDGKITKSSGGINEGKLGKRVYGNFENKTIGANAGGCGDSGSFSRYFSLDAWFDKKLSDLPEGVRRTFPFLIVPKASKSEKDRGCEDLYWEKDNSSFGYHQVDRKRWEWLGKEEERIYKETDKRVSLRARGNIHPTAKNIKLMSYLITLGSRPGDLILDPFLGSGTTAIAAKMLDRQYIGYEINKDYFEIAKARLKAVTTQLSLFT